MLYLLKCSNFKDIEDKCKPQKKLPKPPTNPPIKGEPPGSIYKEYKVNLPGIGFLLSDFNKTRMELFNKGAHKLTLLGLDRLLIKVNAWLKEDFESTYIHLFHPATWSVGGKIYAKNNHYHQPRFSDVAIKMSTDEINNYGSADGMCFAKVHFYSLLLLLFCLNEGSITIDLAVVQWFDFKYSKLSMTTQQNNSTLQQQDSLSKNIYESVNDGVNIIKFFATLIFVRSMLAYIIRIKDEITLMNENLREKMNSGFGNIAKMHEVFEAKLDLMYKEWNFLNEKHQGVEERYQGVEGRYQGVEGRYRRVWSYPVLMIVLILVLYIIFMIKNLQNKISNEANQLKDSDQRK
ncbi:hypothetical protein C1645_742913 [Glomus cerebriforme]|uniref:Uncharacterized protein n=1 Tax=Glomus cerebriforme TaxID=658196 RepID=A0A397SBH2_9GLOM|nr:hypothetical protein C1645_742913 [Glomus cerebriforme]